jgi:hypothetical protein
MGVRVIACVPGCQRMPGVARFRGMTLCMAAL